MSSSGDSTLQRSALDADDPVGQFNFAGPSIEALDAIDSREE